MPRNRHTESITRIERIRGLQQMPGELGNLIYQDSDRPSIAHHVMHRDQDQMGGIIEPNQLDSERRFFAKAERARRLVSYNTILERFFLRIGYPDIHKRN